MNLSVETLSNENDVRAIEDRWGDLANDKPFLHPQWCLAWWECFQTAGMQLRIMVARNSNGTIVGLAPLYLRTSPWLGRELHFLGDGHICSEYLTLLAEPGAEAEVVAAFADALHAHGQSEREGTWDLIDLDCYHTEDRKVNALKVHMQDKGHACHANDVMGCWRINFSEGWEAYLGQLSKSRRNKGRRLLKQILSGGAYEVRWIEHYAELESFMNHLTNLHQKRWKDQGQNGCFADPKFGKFLRQVASSALRSGRAHLLQLNYQGMPVAIQYGLRTGSTIFSYQVGVDTESAAESPGMAMNLLLIHNAIERGLTHLDFLRGDEPYKQSLRAQKVRTERLHVFARYPLAHLRYHCWRAACEAKRFAKDWLKTPQKLNSVVEQEA